MGMRVAFLGPAGTFSEDALLAAVGDEDIDPLPRPSVYSAIRAVADREADRALIPFENSIEGSVRSSLDTLAFEAQGVTIVGEHDFTVQAMLIARENVALESIETVISHPQPLAQCARFLRAELPGATQQGVESTAAAVRLVSESAQPWAAIGARAAAELYGCAILREG